MIKYHIIIYFVPFGNSKRNKEREVGGRGPVMCCTERRVQLHVQRKATAQVSVGEATEHVIRPDTEGVAKRKCS